MGEKQVLEDTVLTAGLDIEKDKEISYTGSWIKFT